MPTTHEQIRKLAYRREFASLEARLNDPDVAVRLAVIQTLADFHYDDLPDVLLRGLRDRAATVRERCLSLLRAHRDTAVAALAGALTIRALAPLCAALLAGSAAGREELRVQPCGALDPLLAAAQDADLPTDLRTDAVTFLARYDSPAVEECLARLAWTAGELRQTVLTALALRETPESTQALLAACSDTTAAWPTDVAVIDRLGRIDDYRAEEVLRRLLSWRGLFVLTPVQRAGAARALDRLTARTARLRAGALSRAAEPTAEPGPGALSRSDRSA